MTDNTQPKALQLSDWLDDQYDPDHRKAEASTELRRLHAENVALQQVLVAAQMKIDHFRGATKMIAPSGEYPPSAAYAELPIPSGVSDDGYNLFLLTQMRDFADRTHALRASLGQAPTHATVAEPCGWLYEWTHSSATGRVDETYTGFTKDEQIARKHDNGWLEAAIAWEVCASLHRQYCKGKDALFTTRQSDFVKHAEDAREYASYGQAPAQAAPGAVAGQCEDAIELLGKYKDLCEEIKRGDSYHLGRIEAAISVLTQADSQSVPVWEEEREAFKAAHRHLGLDEVPDAWGQPTFKHSHVEASWLGWIARAARAPADSVTTPAGGEVAYLDIGAGGYLDLGTDLSNEALSRLPNGRHALVIAGTYGIDGYVPAPPAQAADSVLEDATLLERERICAAIKAEDDYCVDQGNYMLDSDDCIRIVRGEWVRPNFAIDADTSKE